MIIGASLSSFRGLELEQVMELYLRLASEFDLGAVEICLEKKAGKPSLWAEEVNDKIRNLLSNFRITGAHLPFMDLNPISLNLGIKEESLKQLKGAIDGAARLNMDYAVMHARGFASGLSYTKQGDEWERVIAELADYAGNRSILLTIENGDFLGNLKELTTILRRISSRWLKITLDVGHAHIRRIKQANHLLPYSLVGAVLKALDMTFLPFLTRGYMPYEEYGSIKNFLQFEHDLIYNLHIHDNSGRRDHIAIGSGKIDFSFLRKVRFEGPLILEARFENHYRDFKRNYEELRKRINM